MGDTHMGDKDYDFKGCASGHCWTEVEERHGCAGA
jgi:hypothetical protein